MSLRFQWDPQKAARNARKHSVTFAEAVTVFQDLLAYIFDDEEHSGEEHRELIIRLLKSKSPVDCFFH